MPLVRKQSSKNEAWVEAMKNIETLVPKAELDKVVKSTLAAIRKVIKGKKVAYGWSGGKDSIVLGHLCEQLGVADCMIAVCDLEYPMFIKWINENKPKGCTVVNTGQNMAWLIKRPDLLFPDNVKVNRWYAAVQHAAQTKYFKDNTLDYLILGRRRADGNYVGGSDGIYTNGKGVTRYSPLAAWKHEHILAYIHYNNLLVPPIYDWVNGYLCGTHPWAARQYTGSVENGWREVYSIDPTIVETAAAHIESARAFMEGLQT
jgi:3'-phosphoadenosine 5'-phosphosulfate sulfotransferase (PAPS reductase)/FAD synthetase